jgi:2-iminoacetate synthase
MAQRSKGELSRHFKDFIDDNELTSLIQNTKFDPVRFEQVLAKSVAKQALTPAETAVLISATDPAYQERIFATARQLKKDVYGNRIVLFAPLYIGNKCINRCAYCAFKCDNTAMVRKTLNPDEVSGQVVALTKDGHKRLILVFGEHPEYSPQFIAETVRKVYATKTQKGEIRRVNINAAPFDHEGFRIIKEAGIGTYQVFQETYHRETYAKLHPANTMKGDFIWRLDSLSRAFEAGCDDMGIGALFGLYDWRFDVLALVRHSEHLMQTYNVGPHTISFPRMRPADGVNLDPKWFVNDHDFKRLVAILRLSVPYAGMILTAREPAQIRNELLGYGVSQIDAGSNINLIEGYDYEDNDHEKDAAQFELGDTRSLDQVMQELLKGGYIPSFCTSCYRLGRTGEQFMEFAIPGFIEDFCTPNALLTLSEYLMDFGSEETKKAGFKLIEDELAKFPEGHHKDMLLERLEAIRAYKRDIYF